MLNRASMRGFCERCGHRRDMQVERDGLAVCVVCDCASPTRPCSASQSATQRSVMVASRYDLQRRRRLVQRPARLLERTTIAIVTSPK